MKSEKKSYWRYIMMEAFCVRGTLQKNLKCRHMGKPGLDCIFRKNRTICPAFACAELDPKEYRAAIRGIDRLHLPRDLWERFTTRLWSLKNKLKGIEYKFDENGKWVCVKHGNDTNKVNKKRK